MGSRNMLANEITFYTEGAIRRSQQSSQYGLAYWLLWACSSTCSSLLEGWNADRSIVKSEKGAVLARKAGGYLEGAGLSSDLLSQDVANAKI